MDDDGVNRESLDFRAGWIESLRALRQWAMIQSARTSTKESKGIDTVIHRMDDMVREMVAKMRSS